MKRSIYYFLILFYFLCFHFIILISVVSLKFQPTRLQRFGQKLSEGAKRDSENVALLESVRKNLAERWPEDFEKSEVSNLETPIQEMAKDEYQRYAENH